MVLSDRSTCCLCDRQLSHRQNNIALVLPPAAADNSEFKRRIAVAMALLVSSKLLTIQVTQQSHQLRMSQGLRARIRTLFQLRMTHSLWC
jgi:uncharacterized protein (UPF0303 family)